MYNIFQSIEIGKNDEDIRENSEISKNLSLVLEHPLRQDNKLQFNILKSKNVRHRSHKLSVKNIFITVIKENNVTNYSMIIIKRSLLLNQYCSGDKIEKNWMGGECSA